VRRSHTNILDTAPPREAIHRRNAMRLDPLEGVRTLQWSGHHSSHPSDITDTLIEVSPNRGLLPYIAQSSLPLHSWWLSNPRPNCLHEVPAVLEHWRRHRSRLLENRTSPAGSVRQPPSSGRRQPPEGIRSLHCHLPGPSAIRRRQPTGRSSIASASRSTGMICAEAS
jgi:hypothetical protein